MDQISEGETSPLTISEAPQPRKTNFCHILREEFRWRSFGFEFPNTGVFYKSQWRWPRLVFVIFRLCLALYTGIFCILTIVYFPRKNPQRPWPVWLTNWSYLLLTCHEIYAAAVVLIHSTDGTTGCCCRELEDGAGKGDSDDQSGTITRVAGGRKHDVDPVPCYMKLEWLLFATLAPAALTVTINNLRPPMTGIKSIKGFNNHFMNSVVVLLDFCISGIPVRLFHFVYSVIYFAIYFLFSYIFWSFDHNSNVLYDNMDWDDPQNTMFSCVKMGLVTPLVVHIVFFFMYRLKLFTFTKIYGDEERKYEEIYD
jgi:hypothetical protein